MKFTYLIIAAISLTLSSCKPSFFKTGTYEVEHFSYDYNINFLQGGYITFKNDNTGTLVLNNDTTVVDFNYSVKDDNITFDFGNEVIYNYRGKWGLNDFYGYEKVNDTLYRKTCELSKVSGTWNWNTPDYINYGSVKSEKSVSKIGAAMRLKIDWTE